MKKVLFLANLQYGEEPTGGGVQTRNQFMLNWLNNKYDVNFYDTWKKSSIISLLKSFCLTIKDRNQLVVISYGSRGTLMLIRILTILWIKRNIYFFVPGNDYSDLTNIKNINYWRNINGIFVQSRLMVVELSKLGLNNIFYCPNFKNIYYRPKHEFHKGATLKFVYVGRLIEEKGLQIMIDACKSIDANFFLTIYGKETLTYNKDYFGKLGDKRIQYKGYINLKTKEGLDELASHDVMIFPTYFEGEGFSGTLIDALICGLPVIATDFNVNSEVVEDGVTGIIIPPKNVEALSNAMESMIKGEVDIKRMSNNSFEFANKYNIDTVMGIINFEIS